MKPGLADMKNAVVVPHIASASKVIMHLIVYYLSLTCNLRSNVPAATAISHLIHQFSFTWGCRLV